VPQQTKEQAYIGNLGFIKSLMKRYRLQSAGVVELANRFAKSFGCDDIPVLSPMLVGKMGLRGVPGLVVEGKGLIAGPPPGSAAAGGGARGNGGPRGNNGGGGFRNGSGGGPRPDGRRRQNRAGADSGKQGEEPTRKRPRR
jgi:ATP-dependent RNA helicase MSS116